MTIRIYPPAGADQIESDFEREHGADSAWRNDPDEVAKVAKSMGDYIHSEQAEKDAQRPGETTQAWLYRLRKSGAFPAAID